MYAGLCCLVTETDEDGDFRECKEVRTIYADTYENCYKSGEGAYGCSKRQWVIGSSGLGIVKLMVKQIYTFAAFSVGTMAVGTMIFQGIMISVSGVSGDITEAKTKILQALAGIVLLFLSGLILYTINPEFFS